MKISTAIISICLTLFLLCGGCSREEPPPPPKTKIVKPIEKPAPEKPETEEERGKAKTEVIELMSLGTLETDSREIETAMEEVTGYYIVKAGDSLSGIAEDVYGDPLKWPLLYRLNMDILGKLQVEEAFPDRELPGGIRLRIISPDEARENLKGSAHNIWTVNVLSATTNGEIVPSAIRLIRNGYPAYITRAKVKGKDWMRLRVGFFKNKARADTEGKKIMTMLNIDDSWATRVGQKELEEFGRY
jgi:hypothetical protein